MAPVYDLSKGQIIDTSLSPKRRKAINNISNTCTYTSNSSKQPKSLFPIKTGTGLSQTKNTPSNSIGNPYPYHRTSNNLNLNDDLNNENDTYHDNDPNYNNNSSPNHNSEYDIDSYIESEYDDTTDASDSPSAEEAHIRAIVQMKKNDQKLKDLNVSNVEFNVNQSIAMSEIHSLSDDDDSKSSNLMIYQDTEEGLGGSSSSSNQSSIGDRWNDSSEVGIVLGKQTNKKQRSHSKYKKASTSSPTTTTSMSINHHRDKFKLHQDTYTFIFLSPITSWAFLYAIFISFIQSCIFILTIQSLLTNTNPKNPINIPIYISNPSILLFSQAIALFLIIFTTKHILHIIEIINVQYDPNIQIEYNHATWKKWIGSHVLRFGIGGILSMSLSFLIIIQSTNVLQLFVNFVMVYFVSWLDEFGFLVAERGELFCVCVCVCSELVSICFIGIAFIGRFLF